LNFGNSPNVMAKGKKIHLQQFVIIYFGKTKIGSTVLFSKIGKTNPYYAAKGTRRRGWSDFERSRWLNSCTSVQLVKKDRCLWHSLPCRSCGAAGEGEDGAGKKSRDAKTGWQQVAAPIYACAGQGWTVFVIDAQLEVIFYFTWCQVHIPNYWSCF
jgi:hypothetical protein